MTTANQPEDVDRELSRKVVRGGMWVLGIRMADRALSFVRTIVLARLLLPSDFGLLGIALLATSILQTFSRTGFDAALIQKDEDIREDLDTAWTVAVCRGIVLFSFLFFLAPWGALFFESPDAMPILRVMGLSLLISGFANMGVIYFPKELNFRKQFLYVISGTVIETAVAIPLAYYLRNVWALVYPSLVGVLVRVLVSYWIHPYRPRLDFHIKRAHKLFGFGKWVLGSSILLFLITQGDDIFLGKLLGITALGFYQMAFRISNMPATEISHVISQVTFPAYSKLQRDMSRLKDSFLKVLQSVAFVSFPISGLIFALAPDFTRLFLGEKWMPMVPAVRVLVLAGLIRSIAAAAGQVFSAVGRPHILTKLQVLRLLILAVLFYPCTMKWGMVGTSLAVLVSIFLANIGFCALVLKITGLGVRRFVQSLILPLVSGIILVCMALGLKDMMTVGLEEFFLILSGAVVIYLGVSCLLDRIFHSGMQSLISESVQSFR